MPDQSGTNPNLVRNLLNVRPGEIVIFNRSHYEDVLIAKVRELASPQVIENRYGTYPHPHLDVRGLKKQIKAVA